MPEIGQTLAHYSITEKIGKGGMGEVFRAKDQKLGREVAIKVLPAEFAKDADRVARFQREAKLLASLNHPNIAAIYGLEESAGTNFLVLELVEGQTLAELIAGNAGVLAGKGAAETAALPGILKIALQIAEALEAAHEKGVIHRDLKPANIKVTPDGKVKVLDFGLAKAFTGEKAEPNISNSPTLSDMATMQGVILGTAAYMSPEQARGKIVDKRADIWAFGCVLYEMLTGQQTWSGATVTDIIAAALAKDPDFTKLSPDLHPRIRELLNRCLQKDPAERLRDIGDVRIEIKQILADPKGRLVQPAAAGASPQRLPIALSWAVATLILIIAAGVAVWYLKKPESRPVTRLYYELPKDQQFSSPFDANFAISPDGRQLVYSTSNGLYLRSMDELEARLISGTAENPMRPFFSPDGKWIGYFAYNDAKLKKIATSGGTPVSLTQIGRATLGAFNWGADGTIVYGQYNRGIVRVSANGGTPEVIVKAEDAPLAAPQILPDGESVLFTRTTPPAKVMVQSLKSGKRKELFGGDTAKYLPTGHIVYALEGSILAAPFDLAKLEVTGESVPLVEGVFRTVGPHYAVSDSGTLVYVPGGVQRDAMTIMLRAMRGRGAGLQIPGMQGRGRGGEAAPSVSRNIRTTLVWIDRNGKEESLGTAPNFYSSPRISPDGTKVAMGVTESLNTFIWTWDLARKTPTRLTFDENASLNPLWTPDGKHIVYSRQVGAVTNELYWKAADGTGKEEPLVPGGGLPGLYPWSWSRDGKTLIGTSLGMESESSSTAIQRSIDIAALPMEGDGKVKPLLKESYSENHPQVSADGRWMAYTSDESGKNEIFVRPFPNVNEGRWQVSTSGGEKSLWSRDGRELFYQNGDAVMAVPVKTEPAFSPGTPRVLFRGTFASGIPRGNSWDISLDGKRFLMMKAAPQTTETEPAAPVFEAPRRINIVLNWIEEVKQRVPVSR